MLPSFSKTPENWVYNSKLVWLLMQRSIVQCRTTKHCQVYQTENRQYYSNKMLCFIIQSKAPLSNFSQTINEKGKDFFNILYFLLFLVVKKYIKTFLNWIEYFYVLLRQKYMFVEYLLNGLSKMSFNYLSVSNKKWE